MKKGDIDAIAEEVVGIINQRLLEGLKSIEVPIAGGFQNSSVTDLLKLFTWFDHLEFKVLTSKTPHKDTKPGWLRQMLDMKEARKLEKARKEIEEYSSVYLVRFRFFEFVWLPEHHISSLIEELEKIEIHPLSINRLKVYIMPQGTPTCCNNPACHRLCEVRQGFLKGLKPLEADFS
jgi:hypothetical protein